MPVTSRGGRSCVCFPARRESSDVVPQTALIIDGDGRLTYMGVASGA